MQVLVLLLLGAFILGATRLGTWIRDRSLVLLGLCVIAAASYYSLSIVL